MKLGKHKLVLLNETYGEDNAYFVIASQNTFFDIMGFLVKNNRLYLSLD